MSQVNTVLGPVDSDDLGFTLSHEHVTLGAAGAAATYPGFQDRQAIADAATAALVEAYEGGVRTIIDVTTFDLGRDVSMMVEVSRRSGAPAFTSSPAPATTWPCRASSGAHRLTGSPNCSSRR